MCQPAPVFIAFFLSPCACTQPLNIFSSVIEWNRCVRIICNCIRGCVRERDGERARKRERLSAYLSNVMQIKAAGLCSGNKAIDWSTLHCCCVPLSDVLWGSKFAYSD